MWFDSSVLSYLAGVTARSLALAAVALAAIGILRIRTAAARHAIWTVVVTGMLLLALCSLLAPPIPLRVLSSDAGFQAAVPEPGRLAQSSAQSGTAAAPQSGFEWRWPSWEESAVAGYLLVALFLLARLGVGYLFTRRLLHAANRTELEPDAVYESTWISVPLTVGWARPKILLPAGWREWEAAKLASVLAHERTHIRRADWGIALLAGMNRCLFWFHPLAWWLERHLAGLAEQACDDAALLELGSREHYAQALLDIAATVKTGHGRLVWEAMAMAKASEVHMRIERILDETRQIPHGVGRRRWAALLVCSLPLIYAASVVQLAPAQDQVVLPAAAPAQNGLTTADAARMEQQLAREPDDLETRSKLIGYYFVQNVREPRLTHILWMIEHHPEAELTAFNSAGLSPRANALNTIADYERASSLWRRQIAANPRDYRVLSNAAQFYLHSGGDRYEAERLLKQARELPAIQGAPNNAGSKLTELYARVLNTTIDASGAHFPGTDASGFSEKVMAELQSSTDGQFLNQVGNMLAGAARNAPPEQQHFFEQQLNFAEALMQRAERFGGPRASVLGVFGPAAGAPSAVVRTGASLGTAVAPQPAAPAPLQLAEPPQVLSRVDPQYPANARPLKISGIVRLSLQIGPDGHPRNISVMQGHPMLIMSAIDAVKQWIFAPVLQNGVPVTAAFQVTIPFQYDGPVDTQQASAPPPPAAAVPNPVPTRIRVGGNVQMAMVIKRVDPIYPEQARTAGPDGGPLEGVVKLAVIIGYDGSVQSVQPTEGHPMLAPAAEEAVKQWVYRPTLLNGTPVQVSTTVDVMISAK